MGGGGLMFLGAQRSGRAEAPPHCTANSPTPLTPTALQAAPRPRGTLTLQRGGGSKLAAGVRRRRRRSRPTQSVGATSASWACRHHSTVVAALAQRAEFGREFREACGRFFRGMIDAKSLLTICRRRVLEPQTCLHHHAGSCWRLHIQETDCFALDPATRLKRARFCASTRHSRSLTRCLPTRTIAFQPTSPPHHPTTPPPLHPSLHSHRRERVHALGPHPGGHLVPHHSRSRLHARRERRDRRQQVSESARGGWGQQVQPFRLVLLLLLQVWPPCEGGVCQRVAG